MVSEQLQSMGVSRLDRIMEEINRNHELVISMMTEIIEAKSTSRDYSSSPEMAKALDVQMGDSGSASKEGLVKQVSSSDLSIDDDSVVVVTKPVVEIETIVEGSFEKLESDLGVENDINLDIDVPASGGNLNQYAQCLPQFMGNTKLHEVNFPHFRGEGPSEWLMRARKYFQIHQVPDELRVGVAKKYLEGKAYVWFYGFNASHPNVDWGMFSIELCKRFAEKTGEEMSIEEEVIESFSEIMQVGTMVKHEENEEYETEKGQGGEEVNAVLIEIEEHECGVSSEKAYNDKQSITEKPLRRTSSGAPSVNGQILANGTKENGELLEEFTRETDSESGSDTVEHVGNGDEESDEDNESESEDDYEDRGEPASDKGDEVHDRAEMRLAGKTDVIHSVQKGGKSIGEREINALLIQPGDVFKVLPCSSLHILHYLLNPRVVKRMRQLQTSYEEDIPTLNLEDKVNLRGRDVMANLL